MPRLARRFANFALALIAASLLTAVAPVSTPVGFAATVDTGVGTGADSSEETTLDTAVIPSDATDNDFLDLERSLTECISSNPPPGCGRVPTSPGDRGGWQQLVLFGVMMGGIAVIFWRVSRAVRTRDAVSNRD